VTCRIIDLVGCASNDVVIPNSEWFLNGTTKWLLRRTAGPTLVQKEMGTGELHYITYLLGRTVCGVGNAKKQVKDVVPVAGGGFYRSGVPCYTRSFRRGKLAIG